MERGTTSELWAFRELAFFLAWRDIKVRYKQTVLGILWAIIQPFMTMVAFTLIFGQLANIPTDDLPRPVFYFSALVPWLFFSASVTGGGMSLVSNSALLTKIYFPRIILPAATVLSTFADFLIASAFLGVLMLWYDVRFSANLLLWPLAAMLLVLLALALAAFFAALNVRYRDVKYVLPFLIQLLLFATPIIYPSSAIPERFRWLIAINPLTAVIEAFRAAVTPERAIAWGTLGVSALVIGLLFIASIAYFKGAERALADTV